MSDASFRSNVLYKKPHLLPTSPGVSRGQWRPALLLTLSFVLQIFSTSFLGCINYVPGTSPQTVQMIVNLAMTTRTFWSLSRAY